MRGYDAGKKVLGRKRHLLVDTLGLILHVVVHSAAVQDRDGDRLVLPILLARFGWLRCIIVDGGYAGVLVAWVRNLLPRRGLRLEVVKRSDAHKHCFAVLPKRWIVERTSRPQCQRHELPQPKATPWVYPPRRWRPERSR